MSLLTLTNEVINLIASVATFVFPIGIAIFVFQFTSIKDNLVKYEKLKIESVEVPKLERMIKKINNLFASGVVTIFYAIFVKIIISQFINPSNSCVLWLMLIGAIILLVFIFSYFRTLIYEIGIVD